VLADKVSSGIPLATRRVTFVPSSSGASHWSACRDIARADVLSARLRHRLLAMENPP
jgi:hypothetical protein